MRQKYDLGMFDTTKTEISTNSMSGMEEFFKQTFGGDAFVDLIGEISLARLIEDVMGAAAASSSSGPGPAGGGGGDKRDENDRLQEERIQKLYEKLLRKIEPFMEDSESLEQLTSRISEEIIELKKESYGPELLCSIGYIYVSRANKALSKGSFLGIPAMFQGLKEKGHMISEFISTISAFREMMKVVETEQKKQQEEEDENSKESKAAHNNSTSKNESGEEEIKKHEKNEAVMRKAMWKASNLDIEYTLREVCDRIFSGPLDKAKAAGGSGVDKPALLDPEIRKKRALAVKTIGEIFCRIGKSQ